ncbi:MAG: hypothetical protein JRI55_40610, partial [Deltaproteobacteria bacterium]|nr:hypothetical protein [Deltaproteobacteria bacterium]
MMKATTLIGLDLGTINHKLVCQPAAGEPGDRFEISRPGRGEPLATALDLLLAATARLDDGSPVSVAVTGGQAACLSNALGDGFHKVNEVVATAAAVSRDHPGARSILDLGGQFSKWIALAPDSADPFGRVADSALNGLCAAGSGAFLEQQAQRLELGLDELGSMATAATRGATVAGRCRVFAKSDMIHLQQRGTPVDEIAYGLCLSLARTVIGTVLGGRGALPPVVLVGGGAGNRGLVRAFGELLDLGDGDLIVPRDFLYTGAAGAAMYAERFRGAPLGPLARGWRETRAELPAASPGRSGAPAAAGGSPGAQRHRADTSRVEVDEALRHGRVKDVHIGIDVGSVSTNVVLLSPELELLAQVYVRTRGRPVEALDGAFRARV